MYRPNSNVPTDRFASYRFKRSEPDGPVVDADHLKNNNPFTDAFQQIPAMPISELKLRNTDTVAIAVVKAVMRKAIEKGRMPHANEITSQIERLRNMPAEGTNMTLAEAVRQTENRSVLPTWIAETKLEAELDAAEAKDQKESAKADESG